MTSIASIRSLFPRLSWNQQLLSSGVTASGARGLVQAMFYCDQPSSVSPGLGPDSTQLSRNTFKQILTSNTKDAMESADETAPGAQKSTARSVYPLNVDK